MRVLAWIIAANLVGGCVAIVCAAAFALTARADWIPTLISYAIGALLGATFLEVLPHALESGQEARSIGAMVLAGIVLFFVLEKLVIWRHHHHSHAGRSQLPASHAHDFGRSGLMILLGNSFHNLVDGVIIAAAFLEDVRLGVVTAVAIFAHQVPQQTGDLLVLRLTGIGPRRALLLNVASSLASVVGGLLAWLALRGAQQAVPYLLAIAAASMLYVSVADLMPALHQRARPLEALHQVVLIGLGVASIWLADALLAHVR